MKKRLRYLVLFLLGGLLIGNVTACDKLKKKIPPHEMFSQAEQHRKNDDLIEAARIYDDLVRQYSESELVPPALYYSGYCKYTLSLRAPGQKELKQRQDGLSELKQTLYRQWLEYMKDQKNTFSYVEAIDKYQYRGNEFKTLVERYPSSNFVDDAAFQLVRLHINAKQSTNAFTMGHALQLYTEYFTAYPQSPYRPKGLTHLIKLVQDYADALFNHDDITNAYHEFAKVAQDLPDCSRLSYLLALKFLETDDRKNAASILGVSEVIGLGTVETKRTRLNIRSGQGTNYRITTKVEKGEQLILLAQSNGWYHVQLADGTLGYAHGDFIHKL